MTTAATIPRGEVPMKRIIAILVGSGILAGVTAAAAHAANSV